MTMVNRFNVRINCVVNHMAECFYKWHDVKK